MKEIERVQRAFMDAAERKCCDHRCKEGRDCPNDMDWASVWMYFAASAFVFCVIALVVIGLRAAIDWI